MAYIDLTHLTAEEPDIIKFIGSDDRKEYELPIKKTLKSILYMQRELEKLNDKIKSGEIPEDTLIDWDEIYITGWIKTYYPGITLEWVQKNISFELYQNLAGWVHKVFLEGDAKQAEPAKPPKKRKKRKS